MIKFKWATTIALILIAVLFATYFVHTDYIIIKPGSAEDLSRLITVEDETATENKGKFFLVTVSQQRARLLLLLWGIIHPHVEVELRSGIIPPGMTEQEYRHILEQWMVESKLMAQTIALRKLGYTVEIISKGVFVDGFLEDSPSYGILKKGDVITAVDGTRVELANEVISAVQDREVGDPVVLTVLREEEPLEVSVTTFPMPDNPTLPALGIYIRTLHWEPVLPIEVRMETGQIAGPSAGVMFVLEIMNQLTPEDITAGRLIAGTGTIDINERVGPIGGVSQKIVAAEKAGAEYFIVPVENYEEARQARRRINLVPVKTLQEVLDFLDTLEPVEEGTGSSTCPFPVELAA